MFDANAINTSSREAFSQSEQVRLSQELRKQKMEKDIVNLEAAKDRQDQLMKGEEKKIADAFQKPKPRAPRK